MAENITPINFNNPSVPLSKGNIASLANKDTLSNLKDSQSVKTFGDQLKDEGKKQVIKASAESPLIRLYKEKANLIKEGIQLDINHRKKLFDLDQQNKIWQKNQSNQPNTLQESTPPQLTQSAITAGIPPYSYKTSVPGNNQIEIKVYDSTDTIIVDYILDSPNTSYNSIEQSFNSIKDQLKEQKDDSPILKDKKYLIHIYGIPEDQKQSSSVMSSGISDDEYQKAVDIENKNYNEALNNLQERKDQNQKDIDDILKDPFKKQKDEWKKLKEKRKKRVKKTKEERRKARKNKTKAVLKNAKKSLVPILTLLLTNKIAEVIAQNEKIGKLVNDTNNIIIDANESGNQTKLNNAKVARDNAIRIIQSNESKINAIRSQIQRISTYVSIFSVIVSIISAIPLPTSVPPGIGIPTSLIIKFVKILDKANRILLSLSALIPILLSALDKAISILEDYKSQLLNINGQLDKAATNNTLGTISLLSSPGLNEENNFGTISETYKGYRFALKEEDNPKFNVRGFKRHYAVAIDVNNVEVLKSEYSFTLDPNDLIEQLKLAIDNQGLTTGNGLSSLNGNSNLSNNPQTQKNNSNPNQPSTIFGGVPSSSAISKLSQATKNPPQPKVIVGPAGGTTAKIPLGVAEKAKLIAMAAASGPNPAPKIDVAFIIAADVKWQAEYKKYQRSIISSTS